MIGPIMIPMPHMAIICGWRLGRLVSIIAAWLSGEMNAPAAPWSARKITISVMFCAMPHSIEAITKPTTEKMNRRREPILSASQPVIGMATATATI